MSAGPASDAFTGGLPRIVSPPPGPETRRFAERLAGVESRNVTFLGPDFPVFWEEARGGLVRDVDGNLFLDLTGAFGVAAAGHSHPRIAEAVADQALRLPHAMGDVHPPARKVELLERLAGLAPWGDETRTTLATSGSEAVEIALKTALLATGRPGVVAFEGAYHGLTLGSLAATFRKDFRGPFMPRLYPGVGFVPFPVEEEEVARALEELDRALAGGTEGGASEAGRPVTAASDPVGAVILEPIQGRAGVRIPPPGFLAEVARRTRAAGAILIFDEVFTGFGRTGRLFAHEHEGVVPDLMCVGKALGGGLPLSACLGPRRVMDAWPASRGEALHTSTFLGHPLACAASLAFLDLLEEEEMVRRSEESGELLLWSLREELAGVPGVREVRGRGMFVGIELEGAGAGVRTAEAALRRGLLVLPAGSDGEVVELAPPLNLERPQLREAVRILGEAIRNEAPEEAARARR
ncbi:MAG: aspartate aminotransferase family protein [Gemmatimonadota bacterium]